MCASAANLLLRENFIIKDYLQLSHRESDDDKYAGKC